MWHLCKNAPDHASVYRCKSWESLRTACLSEIYLFNSPASSREAVIHFFDAN